MTSAVRSRARQAAPAMVAAAPSKARRPRPALAQQHRSPRPPPAPRRPDPRPSRPTLVGPIHSITGLRRLAVGLLASATVLLCGFVYTEIQVSQVAMNRTRVEAQVAAENVRMESLRSEVASLEAPARIREEAKKRGMVEPETVEYLHVPGRVDPQKK